MLSRKKSNRFTVLITGSTGLLGLGLLKTAPSELELIPTFLKNFNLNHYLDYDFIQLDITNKRKVMELFKEKKPDFLIHCAGIGNVDFCENNKREAYRVNVQGTNNLIEACKKYKTKLIFISSNAVFDGNNPPYNEESKVKPVNYYGKTKVLSENKIKKSGVEYVIVRLILMYGWNHLNERENPVTWLINKLKTGEKINIVNDTYTNPVLNVQAAEAIWKIVTLNKKGIYHVAGGEVVNRFQFAKYVVEIFKLNKNLIKEVESSYFKNIATRMPNTTYDTSKMQNELNIKPLNIKDGLIWMKKNEENFKQ